MSTIDYMKIIDIISKLLEANRQVDLTATHDKIDIFDVITHCYDGTDVPYRILLRKYDMDVIFKIDDFPANMKFSKFVSRFEYEMEQTFLTNVHIESEEESIKYKVKISM